ncbi:hypothetical protein NJH49_11110 [Stenotrophomonas maltophilia]|uniref:hypothetical protein n=1 Tax=Stenotrophomonas maltophilia TaxID=40324 RepID=UPI0020972059|nr:hypothetical protein [Stenotrophomonas maltophilia]MCO7399626.1 hypothetical protein [Stenotrophomonas maltophilia]MCO7411933.1 hypothetical protein [Stenotrophomonas maltophilia]
MRWPWSAAPIPRLDDAQADVLLQDLLSRDASRITDAARTVARLFTPSSLEALASHADLIERHCQPIELGGMLVSNQAHLKAALRRLRHWQAREGCLCALNPTYPFFDPRRLLEQGHMQLLSLQEAEDGWGDCHTVACAHCGQHWQAIDREYHYPWWEWLSG